MLPRTLLRYVVVPALLGWIIPAAARAVSPEAAFYKAYYLEEEGDCKAAIELYEEVVQTRGADQELVAKARQRLAGCKEDLAAGELARLLPPDPLAFIELREPGKHLLGLADSLGVLGTGEKVMQAGTKRLAISPALVKEILGIKGVAVAVTGFDPQRGEPTGVVVLHPGQVEIIRGLLETAMPAGGTATEPIEGYSVFDAEGEAIVALTSRLVVAGRNRDDVAGVLRRLSGKEKASLAASEFYRQAVSDRTDDLLTFAINAKRVTPMVKGMLQQQGGPPQELALADALIDLDSLEILAGNIQLGAHGLGAEIAIRLAEGHRSLAFNLLRTPAIDKKTLQVVPEGAAYVAAMALNPSPARYEGGKGGPAVVTALDFGRELFGNITTLAVAVLPPPEGDASGPIPHAIAVFTVNDPAKSEALWNLVLGLASLASGSPSIEGESITLNGVKVRQFAIQGVPLLVAADDHDLLIATSRFALGRSLEAKRSGRSIADEPAFAAIAGRMDDSTTGFDFLHARRAFDVARPFVGEADLAEIQPLLPKLTDTTVWAQTQHSDNVLRVSVGVQGLPNVGDIVAQLMTAEARKEQQRAQVRRAVGAKDWAAAMKLIDDQIAANPGDASLLRQKFDILATGTKERDAALRVGRDLAARFNNDARALNNFAWALLTEDRYGDGYAELAHEMSVRSNDLSGHNNWAYLDTLAWAKFKTGAAAEAVTIQQKAISLAGEKPSEELRNSLKRFEAAAAGS